MSHTHWRAREFMRVVEFSNRSLGRTMSLWDRICQLLPESWSRTASNSVRVLVTGKTGTGKSSLINGIIGNDVAKEGHQLGRGTTAVASHNCKYQDVDVTVWDSPGLQDGLDKEAEYLKDMREKCANVDLVLYCTRMDDNRARDDDIKAIEKITKALGRELWKNAVFVLTFANRAEPPPKRAYQTEEREDPKQFFIKRMAEWKEKLCEAMQKAGVDPKVIENVPFVPAGYDAAESLPDRNDWLSPLWYASIIRMKENAQPALLKANLHRIKLPDEVKPEDFRKPLHQQPLILPKITKMTIAKYGSPPPICLAIGVALGAVVAGPIGGVVGGAAGAGVGAAVDGIIAYFSSGGDELEDSAATEVEDFTEVGDVAADD